MFLNREKYKWSFVGIVIGFLIAGCFCNGLLFHEWKDVMAALIGAAVGGGVTWLTTRELIDQQIKLEKVKSELIQIHFIKAVKTEIKILKDIYMQMVGNETEKLKVGEPLNLTWSNHQDYFTIYQGNSSFIGGVTDDVLRELIVATYAKAKGLLDSYSHNNELVERLDYLAKESRTGFGMKPKVTAEQYKDHLTMMVKYAEGIKGSHQDFLKNVNELLAKI